MALAGFSFANSFIVVETLSVLFLKTFNILILRHGSDTVVAEVMLFERMATALVVNCKLKSRGSEENPQPELSYHMITCRYCAAERT